MDSSLLHTSKKSVFSHAAGPGKPQDEVEIPLTFGQRRIIQQFSFQSGQEPNLTALVRLQGFVNVPALERALNEVAAGNSALRARFQRAGDEPVQLHTASPPIAVLGQREFDASTDQDALAWARRFARGESQRSFDLRAALPFRVTLLSREEQDHFLVATAHPLVCDCRSLVLIVRQLLGHYRFALAGRRAPLRGGRGKRTPTFASRIENLASLTHWRKHFSQPSEPLDFPSDQPRNAASHNGRGDFFFPLPHAIVAPLRVLANEEGAGLEDAFLAAFEILLQNTTGQDSFVLGVHSLPREQVTSGHEVGRHSCHLPMRARLDRARTFRVLLTQVRDRLRTARRHAGPGFEEAFRESQQSAGRQPTSHFSAAFSFYQPTFHSLRFAGLTATLLDLESEQPACDLALEVRKNGPELIGRLVYQTGAVSASTVMGMADHYQTLLANLTRQPDLALNRVPLLSESEARTVLEDWNRTHADYPTEFCLHELFEAQVRRTPLAVALVHQNRECTYAELHDRAEALARQLRRLGVGPDVPVAISAEPSFEMIVGLLGILKAGGAYVPIDPGTPSERLRFLLADTAAPVLLTQRHLLGGWPDLTGQTLLLDEVPPKDDGGEPPAVRVSPDHLAYIIYTSGSTGTPKGVMVPHRAIANTLHWRQDVFPLGPEDRVLQSFSFTFDASLWELFAPLLAGARLILAGVEAARDGRRLVELVLEHGITALQIIPSRLGLLLDERGFAECRTLRHVISGGEAMTGALQERFFACLPSASLHNLYGPTETALDATFWTCRPEDGRSAIPIGRAIANKRLYLLDRHKRPVPVGVPGELYIGGAGLARGYLRNPVLTAERFVSDPFAPEPDARMYRTGDLCRWTSDGLLLFLSRTDHQVKVRGYRIEPGEIEAALARHPAVRQAVVVARTDDTTGEARLVAYVVPVPGMAPTPAELRHSLRGRLPEYMVPSAVVLLEQFPRTTTGKLDLRALPAPEAPTSRTASGPPQDVVEQFLASLWEDVLNVKGVSSGDDFFDLGGTSLQVAVLIHRLQDRLGEYVYTIALYDAPTLTALATYLRTHYATAVVRLFGPEALKGAEHGHRFVDEARIAEARSLLKLLPPRKTDETRSTPKNRRAVFVLSPPRSGSTLFRVLLGGSPQLFAPPELQLLNFETLAERHRAFDTERDRFWLDGTVRAIMEARHCDAGEASRLMEDCVRRGLTVKEFYAQVQEWIGESMFVDKTPTYALDPQTLQRAEDDFEQPLFIHLIRHPSPAISSFEEAKLHVFFPPFFRAPHPFGVQELAELVWQISHRNILNFLKGVPNERRHEVRFEELVKRPDHVMTGVARFLGVPYHAAMSDPFRQDHKSRMTDGLHPMARMLGDVKFHEHQGIEAQAAERKKGRFPEEKLGQPTREIARELGYTLRGEDPAPCVQNVQNGHQAGAGGRPGPRCLVKLQAGEPGRRPLFCVHPAGGTASCYGDLVRNLGGEWPMYGFQSPGVAGERARPVRLEALATRYLDELTAVQPEGPYRIAGWSVGGVVAYEMAQQLKLRGQEVSLLALFDSDIPQQTERMKRIDPELVLAELAKPFGLDTRANGLVGEARLQCILDQAQGAGILPSDFTTTQLRRLFRHHARVFRSNVRAVRRYSPLPSGHGMVLFRPVDRSITAVTGPKRDWASYAASVATCTVPGDHFSMMREPHVRDLAEQLRHYLAEAETPSKPPLQPDGHLA